MFTAVLDTCVLWPSKQRDLLLSLAAEGLYRPLWSAVILEELEDAEVQKLLGRGHDLKRAESAARRLIGEMQGAFDDAMVEGWELLDGVFGLPDEDDEHVVAAAVTAGADVIVTSNLVDMPSHLVPEHIEVQHPQEFLANTVTVSPGAAGNAVAAMLGRYRNPALTADELLEIFERRYGLTEAVAVLREVCRER